MPLLEAFIEETSNRPIAIDRSFYICTRHAGGDCLDHQRVEVRMLHFLHPVTLEHVLEAGVETVIIVHQHRAALAPGLRTADSEVRPARHRYWFFLLAEGVDAFPIGAARFDDSSRRLGLARTHLNVHGLNKGYRIFDGDFGL
jgi:hypothetical protein